MREARPISWSVIWLLGGAIVLLVVQDGLTFDLAQFARRQGLPVYEVEILSEIPHDTASFTQGLVYDSGAIYESTGLYGESSLRELDAATGDVLKSVPLAENVFGEGLTIWRDEIVQLTWQEHMALVYDKASMEPTRTHLYTTEGWGITTLVDTLVMSDGGHQLCKRKPDNFSVIGILPVTIGGQYINALNELEFANGKLYANVLGLDFILEIHPSTGKVTGVIDASSLRARIQSGEVEKPLNGIAHDPATGDFFLTGKLWPTIFRVRFVQSFGE